LLPPQPGIFPKHFTLQFFFFPFLSPPFFLLFSFSFGQFSGLFQFSFFTTKHYQFQLSSFLLVFQFFLLLHFHLFLQDFLFFQFFLCVSPNKRTQKNMRRESIEKAVANERAPKHTLQYYHRTLSSSSSAAARTFDTLRDGPRFVFGVFGVVLLASHSNLFADAFGLHTAPKNKGRLGVQQNE
jgi:hypothetical protein